MSSKILIKRSTTTGAIPTTADLDTGEFAVNTVDKRIFTNNQGTIVELGTTPSTQAVAGNATVGGTFAVTGATTLSTGSTTGNFSVAGTLQLDTEGTASNHVVTKAYVDTAISDLVDGAGSALDTLKELADAINNDANFATTITNSIATKLTKSGDTMTGNLNMGSNKVTTTANPTADDDLTRKGYVDTILGSATAAATSASEAATSASNAATSESNAAASATSASSSATSASSSASSASASATSASTSASSASTSASQASTSASNAATSATNAENAFDSFDDRYLGAKASDPTVDNDGDALIEGALYFNTTNDRMFVYTGSTWSAVSDVEALYNSGNLKLATTATGVDVTGTITADGLTIDGDATVDSVEFTVNTSFPTVGTTLNANGFSYEMTGSQGKIFRSSGNTKALMQIGSDGNFHLYEDTGTTAKFIWDSSAESLGIGTSSPASYDVDFNKVVVYGANASGMTIASGTASAGTLAFADGTTGDAKYRGYVQYMHADDSLRMGTSGAEKIRIDSSGNVGIGNNNPSSFNGGGNRFVVGSGANFQGMSIYSAVEGNIYFADGTSGTETYAGSIGYNHSSNSLYMYANGAERARIDSSGNLRVGNTSTEVSTTGGRMLADGRIIAVADSKTCFTARRLTNEGDMSTFINNNGEGLGSIRSDGGTILQLNADATDKGVFLSRAGINVVGFAPNEANVFRPATDNVCDLGTSTRRFDDIYATNGTIQTSDRNEKQDIEVLSEAEQRVAQACKGLLRKFRWKDAVEEKGDEARIHFGIIAQDLQDAFTAEGLDAGRYAMFISSTWTDEETGEERTRLGVRYPELLAFIISAL